MAAWRRAVTLVNGRIVTPSGLASSIRFRSRVIDVDRPPRRSDAVVDVDGAFVLPGLINSHDHLELNNFGRLTFRNRYANVRDWIDDMRPRLQEDPDIRRRRSVPLSDRLLIGAVKNLLAGVTTVAHHNPLYPELTRSFPVRLVRRYGWAHSFLLEHGPVGARGERGGVVRDRFRKTKPSHPFFVHVGEGTDGAARAELSRLDEQGALASNTVIIHGVAIDDEEWTRAAARGASLVWCPASNHFLLGETPPIGRWLAAGTGGRICLGTDSRLSGSEDLLDEMRCAARHAGVTARDVLRMATETAAKVIRMPEVGRLEPGAQADLIVIPSEDRDPAAALLAATRADMALVTVGGRPRVGTAAMAAIFAARGVRSSALIVDGQPRIADAKLVRALADAMVGEAGVEPLH